MAWRVGRKRREGGADFFLAGRNVGWFVVGASIFASNIGSEHLVGLAGSAASEGLPVAQFEILAAFALLLLGWLFVPFYLRSGVFTMPEFLEKRYSRGPRTYLAVISVVGYVLTKIAVTVAAGGIVFETLMGIPFWWGALAIVALTGIYTAWGGLRAVLYTDMVQMFVLLGGAVAVTVIGLNTVGGWEGMQHAVKPQALSLWRGMSHPEFPWTGILFGAPILAVWYWCTDQFIVQRVLAANGIDAARRGTIFAAWLKQLPLFLFVFPGVLALALSNTGALELEDPDQALPAMIAALLPVGLKGLVAAGLLAALMSSLSSVFNSASTIFTVDLYRRMAPAANEARLVAVGRAATVVMVLLALLWIPFMDFVSGGLFTYLQSVQAYIAPPIAVVFLAGVLWPGANAAGAKWALAVGAVLGLARLLIEVVTGMDPDAYAGSLWLALADINFLHIALGLFAVSVAVLVGVSLATGRGSSELTARREDFGNQPGWRGDFAWSAGVVLLVMLIWVVFSHWVLAR